MSEELVERGKRKLTRNLLPLKTTFTVTLGSLFRNDDAKEKLSSFYFLSLPSFLPFSFWMDGDRKLETVSPGNTGYYYR